MDIPTWVAYFEKLSRFFRDYEENRLIYDNQKIEEVMGKARYHHETLSEICAFVSIGSSITGENEYCPYDQLDFIVLEAIEQEIKTLQARLLEMVSSLNEMDVINHTLQPRVLDFELDQMCHLKSIGISWTEIASIFGISRMSLYLKRKKAGLLEEFTYTDISDIDLEHEVRDIKHVLPDVGEKMIAGILHTKNIHVQRHRVRQAIHSVDPINTALRWHKKIQRRVYSVPGPMSLWHIGM